MAGNTELIEVGAQRFSVRVSGDKDAPALIFLHGIGSGAASWNAQLEALAETRHCIAWDAPGYGASSPLGKRNPIASDYADALLVLVNALALERFDLLGHSLGAIVAAAFCARHRARIERLILSGCAVGHGKLDNNVRQKKLSDRCDALATLGPAEHAQQRAHRLVSTRAQPGALDAVIAVMATLNLTGYTQAAHVLSTAHIYDDVAMFVHAPPPTLVICGKDDVITTPDSTGGVAQAIPGAVFKTIANAGHAPYVEQSATYNTAIRSFLDAPA